MITKQEEIEEWINKYLTKRFISSDCPDDECLTEANAILTYLHSQGVVIKVDREFQRPSSYHSPCGPYSSGYWHATIDHKEAGCGFFEPLIKE